MIDGIINVYKDAGFTSHDVVAKLRKILQQKKIGHTGTLDPAATGVLPVCLGKGTRVCAMLTESRKTYEAVMRLGVETDTQDMTGNILAVRDAACTEREVVETIGSFLGAQTQIPPMYSAKKVGGKKLYELAREGIVVERKACPVYFHELTVLETDLPLVRFRVTCSKGTYIRTLCHDIGQKLGCGAAMESLVRTRVDRFVIEESRTLEEIAEYFTQGRAEELVCRIEDFFSEYPVWVCSGEQDKLLHNGNPLTVPSDAELPEGWIRFCDSRNCFVGIYERKPGSSRYFPVKMFY